MPCNRLYALDRGQHRADPGERAHYRREGMAAGQMRPRPDRDSFHPNALPVGGQPISVGARRGIGGSTGGEAHKVVGQAVGKQFQPDLFRFGGSDLWRAPFGGRIEAD